MTPWPRRANDLSMEIWDNMRHKSSTESFAIIAKALLAVREEALKESEEIAREHVLHNAKLDYDIGWNRGAELIADEIKALKQGAGEAPSERTG